MGFRPFASQHRYGFLNGFHQNSKRILIGTVLKKSRGKKIIVKRNCREKIPQEK